MKNWKVTYSLFSKLEDNIIWKCIKCYLHRISCALNLFNAFLNGYVPLNKNKVYKFFTNHVHWSLWECRRFFSSSINTQVKIKFTLQTYSRVFSVYGCQSAITAERVIWKMLKDFSCRKTALIPKVFLVFFYSAVP